MTDEQWQAAWKLYQSGSSIPPEQLRAFLSTAAGDAEVRDAVLAMFEGTGKTESLDRIGQTIGHYVVTGRLGQGGMGEVYAARDSELGRLVAVKLLSAPLGGTASPLDRFIQEAKAASALNHPNIVTIYEVIHAASRLAIVMELVDGMALRQLCGSPLPIDQVLHLGEQIARALAAAHARGIVHCDIKPENLMVRPDGFVKVMDFGLARDLASITTSSVPAAGTLRYMPPEQSRGEAPSPACDIFSLGIVLYELATGKHPFDSGSVFETLKALNENEPNPPSSLNTFVPANLDALILKMLAKDPSQRPTAAEVAQMLGSGFSGQQAAFPPLRDANLKRRLREVGDGQQPLETTPVPAPASNWAGRMLPWTVAAAAVAGLAILWALYHSKATAPKIQVEMVVPATDERFSFALSPDGRRIAFAASEDGPRRLWVRALDSISAQPLPGTEGATSPFWSPDGHSLAFFADYKLKRVDLGGAQPQVLAAVPSNSAQGTWGTGGVILFSWGVTPVSRVPASGGHPTVATKFAKDQNNQFTPRFLPDGRRFLYVVNGVDPGIWLGSLDGAPPLRITSLAVATDSAAEYLPPGWLVRVRQGVLEAQRFDVDLGRLSGNPIPLERPVSVDAGNLAGSFSASPSGAIAWRSGGVGRRQLIWFNRSGQNLGPFGEVGDSTLFAPEISPDGKRVATMRGPVGSSDIWLQGVIRNSRFTFDPADDRYPIWSPDGTRVVFASNRNGAYDLYEKAADGSGTEQVLLRSAELKRLNSWSPDGRFILYWAGQNNGDLMVLPLTGDRKPFSFLSTAFDEQQGVFSPDGKWVAYQSDESGHFEIYVRPFPGPGGQSQVSAGGGHSPRWRADGKELYYLAPDLKLMAAKVVVQGATFTAVTPESLFQTHINQATNRQQYDVARDGRFLILTDLPDTSTEPIHLLLNWQPASR
ncbi:MAG TPA: protein kinase [Candidatus Acidoferrales bacterium]|nr:protein kinase [Candidatus Acidoferrales bacterium]